MGFDASNLTEPTSSSSTNRQDTSPPATDTSFTPTFVDFPSTPKSNKSTVNDKGVQETQKWAEESDEKDDFSQLSDTGKRFMERLPDLSYMLKPSLSLPGDE